jgi:hypothetical protein
MRRRRLSEEHIKRIVGETFKVLKDVPEVSLAQEDGWLCIQVVMLSGQDVGEWQAYPDFTSRATLLRIF